MFDFLFLLISFSLFALTGMYLFSSVHKHLLMTLLSLEYTMLNVYIILVVGVSWESVSSYFLLIFLVFAVSEGGLGLSILVSLIRSHGNDMLKSFSIVW